MSFYHHQLKNGIRIVHKKTSSAVAHCGLVIKGGSRNESDEEQGLAHFIEHVIFKGTSKRKAYHILVEWKMLAESLTPLLLKKKPVYTHRLCLSITIEH